MANYLFVSMDTVPPILSISAEDYLDKSKSATITIQADKQIPNYTIYFIDKNSVKHDIGLTAQDNVLTGTVDISDYATGTGVLFVIADKVVRKKIEIVDSIGEEIEGMDITIQTVNMAFEAEVIR